MQPGSALHLPHLYIIIALVSDGTLGQTAKIDRLIQAGIVLGSGKELHISQDSGTLDLFVRLLPVLPSNLSHCQLEAITQYNKTVTRLLAPIGKNLEQVLQARPRGRLFGPIIGSIALGVATSAQITAAIALVRAQQNANDILALKNALQSSNEAIRQLTYGQDKQLLAISKIQKAVNEQILPALDQLDCAVLGTKLAVQLNLYLIEMTTIFGEQINNPVLATIPLSYILRLTGAELNNVLMKQARSSLSLVQLVSKGLLSGQVIGYDPSVQGLIIRVNLMRTQKIDRALVYQPYVLPITLNSNIVTPIAPECVIQKGTIIEGMSRKDCTELEQDIICRTVTTYTLARDTRLCLQGNISSCRYQQSGTQLHTPFITYNGAVIANCDLVSCRCLRPPMIITQVKGYPLTIITRSVCQELSVDNLVLNIETHHNFSLNPTIIDPLTRVIATTPLEIDSLIQEAQDHANAALAKVEESDKYLRAVTGGNYSNWYIVLVIVLLFGNLGWSLLLTVLLCRSRKQQRRYQQDDSVGSERGVGVGTIQYMS
ncbi:fusion protein [Paraavulavirus neophemae]|uniref:Fusion glycoprotein F0 n=1 Tax=Paraavulavirus wisconsinense TaxID=3052594 RepID=B5L5T8_9MONO|nr:fusion protein [Paraavulavirus wisconsinense]